ncbi:MAG: MaoC family dehydratase [Gammaproteobacteria bacterium]
MSDIYAHAATAALALLQARLGQEVHVSDWMTVTQDRVVAFADATEDHQWIHVDPDRARLESPFGGPIAHGYLTLSLQIVLRGLTGTEQAVAPGVRQVVNYGLDRLRFPAPVPVGARIRGRFTLLEAMQVAPGVLQAKERYTVEVEGKDKPACIAESLYRLYFQ